MLGSRLLNSTVQCVGYLLLDMDLPVMYAQKLQVQVAYLTGSLRDVQVPVHALW